MEGKRLKPAGWLISCIAFPLGLGLFIGGLFMGYYTDVFSMFWNPLTPQGLIWVAIGTVGLLIMWGGGRKAARLKDDGLRYDAEIINISSSNNVNYVRIGGYSASGRVECAYVNQQGERCLVRSRMLLVRGGDSADTLAAVVYVDRDDPKRYAVEVFRKTASAQGFDRDYR